MALGKDLTESLSKEEQLSFPEWGPESRKQEQTEPGESKSGSRPACKREFNVWLNRNELSALVRVMEAVRKDEQLLAGLFFREEEKVYDHISAEGQFRRAFEFAVAGESDNSHYSEYLSKLEMPFDQALKENLGGSLIELRDAHSARTAGDWEDDDTDESPDEGDE